jgi:uncharacterized protein (DUF302 family)
MFRISTVDEVVTRAAPGSVDEVVERLSKILDAKGLKRFAVIDHSGEAAAHGLELRDTKVVVFGSPEAGTPVMAAHPLAALDLPLKILVWADGAETRIGYTAPPALAERYDLEDELSARLAGIEGIAKALSEA